jgi:outer membrane receptor protein involved in Fe transport
MLGTTRYTLPHVPTAHPVDHSTVPLPADLQALAAKVLGAQKTPWSDQQSDNAVMPSGSIEYKLDKAALLYFTYSRGFLAGIPNGGVLNGLTTPSIRPEYVNAYEAGVKSDLFHEHLRLNLDVFRSNYTDLQVANSLFNTAGVPVTVVTNAGSSRSQGVEFAAQWAVGGFQLRSAITYLNARYVSYPNVTLTAVQSFCRTNKTLPYCQQAFPGGVPILQDLSGQPTGFAPNWSGSLTAAYRASLPRGYHFITEADVYASSWYFYGNNGTDDPEQVQPGYARLDGRLTLESPNAHWAVDVVLKNLTDRLIVGGGSGGTSLPTATGSILVQTEQPRNVAVQARYQW